MNGYIKRMENSVRMEYEVGHNRGKRKETRQEGEIAEGRGGGRK